MSTLAHLHYQIGEMPHNEEKASEVKWAETNCRVFRASDLANQASGVSILSDGTVFLPKAKIYIDNAKFAL